jgi:hypothetical protein
LISPCIAKSPKAATKEYGVINSKIVSTGELETRFQEGIRALVYDVHDFQSIYHVRRIQDSDPSVLICPIEKTVGEVWNENDLSSNGDHFSER